MIYHMMVVMILALSLSGCATTKKSTMKELEMRVSDLERRVQEKDDKIQELETTLQKGRRSEQLAVSGRWDASKINKADIQTALKNAGYYNGPIDGKFGQLTADAITEFQKANGLKQDGKVGQQTWSKLSEHLQ